MNRKFDVILFVLDSDYEHRSEHVAKYYERVHERIKTLGLTNSLLMTSYDINENGNHYFNSVRL